MSKLVCETAQLSCNQGLTPCVLSVLTNQIVRVEGKLVATVNDILPINIASFGTCQLLTAMAQGVPQPCLPKIVSPWLQDASKLSIQGQAALNESAKAICSCGGQITINFAGQTTTVV